MAALRALRVGATACNSAETGLGSTTVLAAVVKSPGTRVTVTGTVIGWNLGSVKVTLKPPSVVIGSEQGVVQVGPSDVFASAPGGVDFELDGNRLGCRLEGIHGKR